MMARVLDTTLPGQAAEQIEADGKPWLMARRLYTKDRPPVRPAGKRNIPPAKGDPIFITMGGEAFIERARRDAGSPCRAAAHYDDLRRLLCKEASGAQLVDVERKHLKKSLTAWVKIQCPESVCNSDQCDYLRSERWLKKLKYESLYELIEDRIG